MNFNKFLITFFAFLSVTIGRADEGMWIPSLLGKDRISEMREKGLRLSAEDIYSINHSSLKDAVVLFGRGCTGAIVSDQGLLLTNHHCGFGRIQSHSSIEHDYLTDGFWAMSQEEELPNPGLTVSILVRMEDVTGKVLSGLEPGISEAERDKLIKEVSDKIIEDAVKGTHYDAEVEPLFGGNQYFLYVYEVFKDVRLVGAPPSSIGKFGGDTDNWMWPRHTGDFSIFRIYADANNLPAGYSETNVPYRPPNHFKVSLKGVEKGDFTMVYGYPAITSEYIPASMVEMISGVSNPARIRIRQQILDIIDAGMNADPAVRIKYASKQAGIANAWKKWIGVDKGLARFNAVEKKSAFEEKFNRWVRDENKEEYNSLLTTYDLLVEQSAPDYYWIDHFIEAIWRMDIIRFATGFRNLAGIDKSSEEDWKAELEKVKKKIPGFFKDYDLETDRKIFAAMLELFRESIDRSEWPDVLTIVDNRFDGDVETYTDWVYDNSFLVSEDRVSVFLKDYKPKKVKKILEDPVYAVMQSFFSKYIDDYAADARRFMAQEDSLQRIYMKAIMDMMPDHDFYPDANGTLRITYGQVLDYYPADAVHYDYYTTVTGIMEKDDPAVYDYRVPERLKELYREKDYGRYGRGNEMPVCFIATNHTTGGNSGSPVLNADGQLVGLNFDRCWEGTMSDIMYEPSICRNITLDIRYCLFIIDKFAGAGHLVEEMDIVQ